MKLEFIGWLISPFDSNAKRHTSFASVFVWPQVDDNIEIEIKTEDIKVDTYKASGAGGQHVNTTDSAVRITHEPTGVVVSCQDEKSQTKNKAKAMKILYARILSYEEEKATKKASEERLSQIGTGDRSERIRIINFPQTRLQTIELA